MSDIGSIKEARAKSKQLKRDHIIERVANAITNGNYEFCFGYGSESDLTETIDVLDEINKELKEEKLVLSINSKEPKAINIKQDGKLLFTFAYTCWIKISVL